MSIITVIPSSTAASNITVTNSLGASTSISSNNTTPTTITINQGIPGPPGPPGSGILNIVGGSGISVNVLDGTYTISNSGTMSLSSSSLSSINNGRLTLQPNDPIYMSDVSGSNLYYTPYLGNNISLYNTSNQLWENKTFSQISLNLSGMTSNTNYDIFIYDNNGVLTLERVAWTNNTSRAINIVYQNGVFVKSGDLTKRYVGSIRSTSSTTTEDSVSRRLVYNYNNQINKLLNVSDNISHTYTTGAVRPYRNITTVGATRAEFICGINHIIDIVCDSNFATETASSSVGVSLDSTTSFNTNALNTTNVSSGPSLIFRNHAIDQTNISLGYHYLQLVQYGSNVSTFYNAAIRSLIPC